MCSVGGKSFGSVDGLRAKPGIVHFRDRVARLFLALVVMQDSSPSTNLTHAYIYIYPFIFIEDGEEGRGGVHMMSAAATIATIRSCEHWDSVADRLQKFSSEKGASISYCSLSLSPRL